MGAGPAGMAAALRARESGARVTVLDDNPAPGGQIWRGEEYGCFCPEAVWRWRQATGLPHEWFAKFRAASIDTRFERPRHLRGS